MIWLQKPHSVSSMNANGRNIHVWKGGPTNKQSFTAIIIYEMQYTLNKKESGIWFIYNECHGLLQLLEFYFVKGSWTNLNILSKFFFGQVSISISVLWLLSWTAYYVVKQLQHYTTEVAALQRKIKQFLCIQRAEFLPGACVCIWVCHKTAVPKRCSLKVNMVQMGHGTWHTGSAVAKLQGWDTVCKNVITDRGSWVQLSGNWNTEKLFFISIYMYIYFSSLQCERAASNLPLLTVLRDVTIALLYKGRLALELSTASEQLPKPKHNLMPNSFLCSMLSLARGKNGRELGTWKLWNTQRLLLHCMPQAHLSGQKSCGGMHLWRRGLLRSQRKGSAPAPVDRCTLLVELLHHHDLMPS